MSEEATEPTLISLNAKEAIFVDTMNFGKGDVFVGGHECDDPTHVDGASIPILSIMVKDVDGKFHYLAIPVDSPVTRALLDMDIYYVLRNMLEVDNY